MGSFRLQKKKGNSNLSVALRNCFHVYTNTVIICLSLKRRTKISTDRARLSDP